MYSNEKDVHIDDDVSDIDIKDELIHDIFQTERDEEFNDSQKKSLLGCKQKQDNSFSEKLCLDNDLNSGSEMICVDPPIQSKVTDSLKKDNNQSMNKKAEDMYKRFMNPTQAELKKNSLRFDSVPKSKQKNTKRNPKNVDEILKEVEAEWGDNYKKPVKLQTETQKKATKKKETQKKETQKIEYSSLDKKICLVCNEDCGTTFSEKAKHLKKHSKITCYKCGKEFQHYRYLARHDFLKHRKSVCDQCGVVLSCPKSLARHNETVHGNKEEKHFKCDECSYRTHSKITLWHHRYNKHGSKQKLNCQSSALEGDDVIACEQCHENVKPVMYLRHCKDKHDCKLPPQFIGSDLITLKESILNHLKRKKAQDNKPL